jgi:hypothetical protein
LANDLPYLFDIVGALRVEQDEEGDIYRVLQTGTDTRFVAKDRSGKLNLFEEPTLKNIYDKVFPDGVAKEEPQPEAVGEEATEPGDEREYPVTMYHAESESFFTATNKEEYENALENDCHEVTEDEITRLKIAQEEAAEEEVAEA